MKRRPGRPGGQEDQARGVSVVEVSGEEAGQVDDSDRRPSGGEKTEPPAKRPRQTTSPLPQVFPTTTSTSSSTYCTPHPNHLPNNPSWGYPTYPNQPYFPFYYPPPQTCHSHTPACPLFPYNHLLPTLPGYTSYCPGPRAMFFQENMSNQQPSFCHPPPQPTGIHSGASGPDQAENDHQEGTGAPIPTRDGDGVPGSVHLQRQSGWLW